MNTFHRNIVLLAIAFISLVMHYNHFSKDIISFHVWRQTQTQTNIINFYEGEMNIFNPQRNERADGNGIYRMEFPLMQWGVACAYKVFGNHIIVTRICMFIIGLFSVLGMYKLLMGFFQNINIALIGAWTFSFSPSFYYYIINPLPDNFALCCSIWGIALFLQWHRNKQIYYLVLSGIFLCIGTLCKLPFLLYYAIPFTYFLFYAYENGINKLLISRFFGLFSFFIIPAIWYIIVIPQWSGNGIVLGMMDNAFSIVTILDYMQHNLFSTLPELLINYGSVLFFLAGFYFLYKNKAYKNSLFLPILVWSISVLSYFIFEINMIEKVHDYYLFPFYPLIFLLISYGAYHFFLINSRYTKALAILLFLILPLTCYLRMQDRWDLENPGFNKDLLVYKNDLRKAVPKNALVVVGNDNSPSVFFYYVDKKGWYFKEDQLTAKQLEHMIYKGAQYLYTDSRQVEENVKPLLDSLIMERGSIKVFKIKKSKTEISALL